MLKVLPHRYPFLMIDRVIDIRGDQTGIGIKNVTVNEPQFQGHFPDDPVFPGVLLIEGMAQTGGVLCILARGLDKPRRVYFMTIDKAKFRRPVVPGDTIEYHMQRMAQRRNMWWFRGEAKVAGQVVAEAEVGAMIADAVNAAMIDPSARIAAGGDDRARCFGRALLHHRSACRDRRRLPAASATSTSPGTPRSARAPSSIRLLRSARRRSR